MTIVNRNPPAPQFTKAVSADGQTLTLWQLAALIDYMDTEAKRQKAAQAEARRRR